MTTKRPPALSWQDKAILITIPLVVLLIFVLGNYYSQDPNIEDAIASQMKEINVRDGGIITQVFPQTATSTIKCRLKSLNSSSEFDFIYNITGSETIKFEVGNKVQFYGMYDYNQNGGTVTTPYKSKSGRYDGWVIYKNIRYSAVTPVQQNPMQQR